MPFLEEILQEKRLPFEVSLKDGCDDKTVTPTDLALYHV